MAMPDGSAHGGPWRVMMIGIEDDPAATVVPRLASAGANLSNVLLVTGGASPEVPYNLGENLPATEKMIGQYNVKVVVIDPLMAFLPDKVNGLVDAEIRRALGPLQNMARRLDIAVIVVRHLTKSATRALYAGSGSLGIIGAARAAFLVRPDPRDLEVRVLAPSKTNLVKRPMSLGYRLETDEKRDVARVRWTGKVDLDADALFEGRSAEAYAEDKAAQWLRQFLDGTAKLWPEIVAAGKAAGFSAHALIAGRKDVAEYKLNPTIGAEIKPGSYWYVVGHWPFDGPVSVTESVSVSAFRTAGTPVPGSPEGGNGTSESSDTDPDPDIDRDAELDRRPAVCDQCGSEPALRFGRPHWAVRCRAHNPRSWSP